MTIVGGFFCILLGTAMLVLFVECRLPARVVWSAAAAICLVLLAVNWLVLEWLGDRLYTILFPLINHPPLLLFTFFISRQRGWRQIFQFLSSVLFCFFVQHASGLFYLLCGQRGWALVVGYAVVTTLVLWLFLTRLRPLYLDIVEWLGGWPLLCLPLAIYYGVMFLMIPEVVGSSFLSTVIKPTFTLLAVSVYGVLAALFDLVRRQTRARQDAELVAMQRDALQARLNTVADAEERVAIERHDLRHRLNTLAMLVEAGDLPAARAAIGAASRRLEETQRHRWCAEPTLNATFDFYFALARRQGVQVDSRMAFPETLPAPAAELSVLFANALDNAIRACGEVPEEQRTLTCRAIARPRLMIEVSNPCARPLVWDAEGFPVASRPGHGTGMRSIRSFCRQYGAVCQCTCENGRFCLRVAF